VKMRSVAVVLLAVVGVAWAQGSCGSTPVMPNLGSMAHPKNIHGEIVGGTVATPYSWP